jgi:hypothetical protein
MLKHGEVNPLDVFDLRRLNHCPYHFETIVFDLNTTEKVITDWIYEHLLGRFYLGDSIHWNPMLHQYSMEKTAGFEKPSEASYFGLFLPNINVSIY